MRALGRVAATAGLWVLSGCAAQPTDDVLALFDGGEVTAAQVDAVIRGLAAHQRQPGADQTIEEWIERRVEDAALGRLLLARAVSSNLGSDPAFNLRTRFLACQDVAREYLLSLCPPPEVSEDELIAAYRDRYIQAPRPWILVRHIFKRVPLTATPVERDAVRSAMTRIQADLRDGASFVELARRHSDSETAKDGGLIGRISRDSPMNERVRDAAWELEDGEFSGIIEVDNGFHILLRSESGTEEPPRFEAVAPGLTQEITLAEQEVCGSQVIQEFGRQTDVAIVQENINSLDPAAVILTIGDEEFTLDQLRGLNENLMPLPLSENPGMLLRRFTESILLATAARSEHPRFAEELERTEAEIHDRLLVEAQRRAERRRIVGNRSDDDLRSYFEVNRRRFSTDLELDIGLIVITLDGRPGRRAALEAATSLRERIVRGETFESVAETESVHPSRGQGGRLGSIPLPRLRVILGSSGIEEATALEIGVVSRPIMIHGPPHASYALIKLYGRSEPRLRSFDEAREAVIDSIASERVQQLDAEVRRVVLEQSDFRPQRDNIDDYVESTRW